MERDERSSDLPLSASASLAADYVRLPLHTPYRLIFGDLTHFDTILVTARVDGATGVGEATILTGYTNETCEGGWALARDLIGRFDGKPVAAIRATLARHLDEAPFVATAFLTALDAAERHPVLEPRETVRVPLLAPLNGKTEAEIELELERALGAGFRTIKVKVGFDIEADLKRVAFIRRTLSGRAIMRIDANQSLSKDEAIDFVSRLSPEGIELLEQACAAEDWDAAAAVAQVGRAAGIPIMLDESIYTMADVERAAALEAADIVKLKLMKSGSIDMFLASLDRAAKLGFGIVCGNGVAADVGCRMEALATAGRIIGAGEMNGFHKLSAPIFREPMRLEAGTLVIPPGPAPALDEAAIAAARVDRVGSSE